MDLTKYLERHRFVFDEALDESVTNDQVHMRGGLTSRRHTAWKSAQPAV